MNANLLSHQTGSLLELEKAAAQRLLAISFNEIEIEYLQQGRQFQEAVAEMNTLDAFKKSVTLGHLLLIERDERNSPSNVIKQTNQLDPSKQARSIPP